jgi:hypothetical protein
LLFVGLFPATGINIKAGAYKHRYFYCLTFRGVAERAVRANRICKSVGAENVPEDRSGTLSHSGNVQIAMRGELLRLARVYGFLVYAGTASIPRADACSTRMAQKMVEDDWLVKDGHRYEPTEPWLEGHRMI